MSGPDTQQGPPPPPPPPSGSPFGRFLTTPVLLVGVLALVVGFATFRYVAEDGGPGDAAPASAVAGSWETMPTSSGSDHNVQLELARTGGTLTVDGCTGDLTPLDTGGDEWLLGYTDTSGERGCPRRLEVAVTLVDDDTLRLEARRRGRPYVSARLRRR